MTEKPQLNPKVIELLEDLNEKAEELESPALSKIETKTYTKSNDVVCGVCGETDAYGNTWIVDAFEFPETPEDQEQDRLCWSCLGVYLNTGEWKDSYEWQENHD